MMRKLLIALCIIPVLMAAKGTDKTTKAERKKTFVSACNEEGDKQFTDPTIRKYFHQYCACAGEQVSAKFSENDWLAIDSLTGAGMDSLVTEKITTVVQPCLVEFQLRLEKMHNEKK